MPVRFPIEVCELIIEHIPNSDWNNIDQASLNACCLTCRALYPVACRRLYHWIDLYDPDVGHLFLRTISSEESLAKPWLFVQRLWIGDTSDEGHGEEWLNELLPMLGVRLTNVMDIRLIHLPWTILEDASASAILSGFQKVRHLDLENMRFDSSADFHNLVASFPFLAHLACVGIQCAWTDQLVALPKSLRSIELSKDLFVHFNELLQLDESPHIRILKLWYLQTNNVAHAGDIIRTIGPGLEDIDFGEYGDLQDVLFTQPKILDTPFENAMLTHISFAPCLNLRSVGFDCGLIARQTPPFTNWVCPLLSQIGSSRMEEIRLCFHVIDVADLTLIDWHRLERIFIQPRWAMFRRLEIIWACVPAVGQLVSAAVKSHLRLLAGHGVEVICNRIIAVDAESWLSGVEQSTSLSPMEL